MVKIKSSLLLQSVNPTEKNVKIATFLLSNLCWEELITCLTSSMAFSPPLKNEPEYVVVTYRFHNSRASNPKLYISVLDSLNFRIFMNK